MFDTISRSWWIVVLRGVVSVLFGVAAIAMPNATLAALVMLFGVFSTANGVLSLIAVFSPTTYQSRWALAFQGLVSLAAGAISFAYPNITALAFLYMIAAWAILTGVFEIVAAVELRKVIADEWLLALSGIASVLFGVYVAAYPDQGALAVLWTIAAYAIGTGVLLIVLGFRLRGISQTVEQARAA